MTDLSGVELRKELCEAIGWRLLPPSDLYQERWAAPTIEERDKCLSIATPWTAADLPKYDSDATLFFGLLETVCKERSWYAEVHLDKEPRCKIWLSRVNIVTEHGATLTEAGCRCLLAALRSVK